MLSDIEVFGFSQIFTFYFNSPTFRREFESIRLYIQEHLLDSLHVAKYHESVFVTISMILEALVLLDDLNVHEISLFFLNHIDLLDGFLNIKVADIFSEFAGLKLRKIEDIIDNELQ